MKHDYFRNLEKIASKDEFPTNLGDSTIYDLYELLVTFQGPRSLLDRGMSDPTKDELEHVHVLLEDLIVYPETFETEFNMRKSDVWYYADIAEVWHPYILEMLFRKG